MSIIIEECMMCRVVWKMEPEVVSTTRVSCNKKAHSSVTIKKRLSKRPASLRSKETIEFCLRGWPIS
jgi:hypothetical protein